MAARQDGRIEKGQPISQAISARAWNRAQQAADVVLGVQPGTEAGAGALTQLPYTWLYVKMMNGSANYGDCVYMTSFVMANDASADYLSDSQLMNGTPVVTGYINTNNNGTSVIENRAAFGVAVEPIQQNAIGRVAVSGVVSCNVFCRRGWHGHAIQAAQSNRSDAALESSAWGNIDILFWHQSAGIDRWSDDPVNKKASALVRIGNVNQSQTQIVVVPANWNKNTRRYVETGFDFAKSLGFNANGTPNGAASFPAGDHVVGPQLCVRPQQELLNGTLPVVNVLVDIKHGGIGIATQMGEEWVLIAWTPYELSINGQQFWATTYA